MRIGEERDEARAELAALLADDGKHDPAIAARVEKVKARLEMLERAAARYPVSAPLGQPDSAGGIVSQT